MSRVEGAAMSMTAERLIGALALVLAAAMVVGITLFH